MNSFKNNRIVLATFAILMVIGLMAAYIPMLFPPSGSQNLSPEDNAPAPNDDYAAQLPKNDEVAPATSSVPAAGSLPDSLSGFQDEQKSLDDLNSLLGN